MIRNWYNQITTPDMYIETSETKNIYCNIKHNNYSEFSTKECQ